MSDLIIPDPPEQPVGPDPAPNPYEEAADAAHTAAAAEADTPAEDPEVFDRAYVEELRRENAKYRTRAREYESIFGDMDEESRDLLTDYFRTAQLAAEGDEDAARRLVEDFGVEDEPESVEAVAQETGLTEEAVQRMIAEALGQRDQQSAQQDAIKAVQDRASTEFGYDLASEDYILLMRAANSQQAMESDDPLAAGHEMVQAYKQKLIDAYLADKEQQSANSPRLAGNGAAPANPVGPPSSWAEARARTSERLDRIQSGA